MGGYPGPLPMMRAAVAALLVAGAAAYSCPARSYFSGGSWPPASFDSCTCFGGLVKHNGGCINPTAVPGYTNPCNITECPSGSFMNSWPVCNLDDCTCNYGYLENTAGGCDRNTFTCPANSYQYTSGSPTDTTGCRCNYGYQADNGAPPGHLFTSCVVVASTTSGTTTSSTFSCPANSYQYAAGTATSTADCRCNWGYSPDNGAAPGQNFTSCVQTAVTTFSCPANSYQHAAGAATSTADCRCNWGWSPLPAVQVGQAFDNCTRDAAVTFSCPANSYQFTAGSATSNEHCRCNYGYSPEIPTNGVCVQNAATSTTVTCDDIEVTAGACPTGTLATLAQFQGACGADAA